jgi:hypothetical protein
VSTIDELIPREMFVTSRLPEVVAETMSDIDTGIRATECTNVHTGIHQGFLCHLEEQANPNVHLIHLFGIEPKKILVKPGNFGKGTGPRREVLVSFGVPSSLCCHIPLMCEMIGKLTGVAGRRCAKRVAGTEECHVGF